ncbi:MAG: aspartate--tRNA ligase [Candidatus Dormibacteraeota bacterium]|nr:aspartate--tRNA ligase [Candidatus Dormibacteraeota bacterium]
MSGFTAPHVGSLRATDAGRQVELYGWIARRRDHGGLIFVDLRDRWGVVQVVFNPERAPAAHDRASDLRSEFVVRVVGVVERRPAGMENPNLATGEVEVFADDLELLSPSKTPPFPIEDDPEPEEQLRLRYRYLDLRRPRLQRILQLRHRMNKITHDYFDDLDFIEVETPILTKSTPEGARDFLVPSRLYPGEFYALPQSPQQLKQLLMVSGVQRYYQIARCLRDEDLRADRSAEFTQLDLEMSFCAEEDVFEVIEGWIGRLWKDVLEVELPRPWPRLSMNEALLRYGTDKPDLRYGLEITDVSPALAQTRFRVFRSVLEGRGVVRALALPGGRELSRREIDELVTLARGAGGQGLFWLPGGPGASNLEPGEVEEIMRLTGAGPDDLVLMVADRRRRAEKVMGIVRTEIARRQGLVRDQWRFLWVYPMNLFEEDDEGNLTYGTHPFTRPMEADLDLVDERPYDVRAHAYDFICNGYELGGGSLRIYTRDLQERVFRILGLSEEQIQGRFGHLLQAFEYGVPPHGGIAAGLDRIVMMLAGTENIRDVIAFPKTQSMLDLLMDAPGQVDPSQLNELGLQVKPRAPAIR